MGLHICSLVPRTTDGRGEYVEVANDGNASVAVTGLEITDYTETQQRPHVYRFPALSNGAPLSLRPAQSAYVFTGRGRDTLSNQGDWLLFAGLVAPVWNDDGDVAYLRDARGRIVDSMTVGDPKRHPNGH